MSRLPFKVIVCSLLALTTILSLGQQPAGAPPPNLHIYLLIGQSNMAGRAEIPEDAKGILDRCYLFNEKNEWEPASNPLNRHSPIKDEPGLQKLGPGYSFARKMLEKDKNLSIGLVVNAGGGETGIDGWLGKSKLYWSARKRAKEAMKQGTLKGILWHQGEIDQARADGYLEKLKAIIGNLRADLNSPSLPFVAGQIAADGPINGEIAKLPGVAHSAGFVPSKDLTTTDGTHFDTKSQMLLGERYAETMISLQAKLPPPPKPPADIRFIDPHVHAMAVTPEGLLSVAQWMEQRNVEQCIVSPLDHKGSRPQNEQERQQMIENFKPYLGRIHRMTIINPGEVQTVDEAVKILEQEKADGAVAFGEHYGVDLMFDDPKNLLLYEACEKVGFPVMFHIDQNKNMVEPGMERVDRVLKMFPKCKVVAHAYWWRQFANGTCDRQLQEHPNLYADMSGHVVIQVLNRDRKYAREFLIRNQDKIMWATDEGWWSFGKQESQMNQHYTFFEELDLPKEVRYKIYRGNAMKVYGLKEPAEK
jgi:uncharacterized protein